MKLRLNEFRTKVAKSAKKAFTFANFAPFARPFLN